jgi:hypothetical protein
VDVVFEGPETGVSDGRDRPEPVRHQVLFGIRADHEGLAVVEEAPRQPGVVLAEQPQLFAADDPGDVAEWFRRRRGRALLGFAPRGTDEKDDGDEGDGEDGGGGDGYSE